MHQLEINQRPHDPPPFSERRFDEHPPRHLPPNRPVSLHPRSFDDALFIILVLGFSTGMRILQHSRQEEEQQKEMEKAHVETELAFLKNQVNPHFFFNSLNNIHALITIDSEAAQKAVEKLSGLMRYLIYESDVKTVKLQKEFEFTRNYIDLMKQRLSSKVKLTVDIQQDIPDIEIPPLIFIPFIENAFKHGISYRDGSFISISLRIRENKICFSCKNSIPQTNGDHKKKNGGIGIVNIKKRLELLYGDNARFKQETSDDTFNVELLLPTDHIL
ncbi:MAG: histidine kinase [candidate division KSB1 bacterium]|nr:histidine kinase [candidate division KSB1 bacterium]